MADAVVAVIFMFVVTAVPAPEVGWFAHRALKGGRDAALAAGAGILMARPLVIVLAMALSSSMPAPGDGWVAFSAAYLVVAGGAMIALARRPSGGAGGSVDVQPARDAGVGLLLAVVNPFALLLLEWVAPNPGQDATEALMYCALGTLLALAAYGVLADLARRYAAPQNAPRILWALVGVAGVGAGIALYMK